MEAKHFLVMMRVFAMAVFLASVVHLDASDPLDNWHWRTPLPQGYTLNGAAGTSNLYVAVGELGSVLVSTNGVDWIPTNGPVVTNLNAVCFAVNRFVAVGDGGTILTSTSGTTWTLRTSPTPNDLYSVTSADGLLVAVGNRGTILTSPTGSSWALRDAQLGTNVTLRDVTFGNGRFVTVGHALVFDYTVGVSAASRDAISWEQAGGWTLFELESVTFGNGVFLTASGGAFGTSADGLQWNFYSAGSKTNATDLAFANGQFIASSASGVSGVLLSSNGTNWTAAGGVPDPFQRVAVVGDHGIAVGTTGRLATSTNLADWRMISSGPDAYLHSITFGKGLFVGVNGVNVLTSVDGRAWTRRIVASTASLQSVAYGKGVFIIVGSPFFSATNLISTDAESWSPLRIPVAGALHAIVFANERFVAVGDYGTTCESTDGTNWTTHPVPGGARLDAIGYGNGQFIAAGAGAIYASGDLVNWTFAGGSNVNWYAVAYGNGLFVAGGFTQYGKAGAPVMRSFNGITWEEGSGGPSFHALAFGRGRFVGAATEGIVASTNGLDWVFPWNRPFPVAQAVAFGRETFVAGRFPGGIVQSDEVVPLPRFAAPAYSQGKFLLSLTSGEIGASYAIQSSADLKDWGNETTVSPFQFPFMITNLVSEPARFYRAIGQ